MTHFSLLFLKELYAIFWLVNLTERDYLEDLDVHGRIILE